MSAVRTDPEATPIGGPIVDAHMHLWDLSLGKHPWLCEAPPIAFRYGDYAAIRANYLPDDYLADAAPLDVAATVYVEAEWDPADPIAETRWVHAVAEREGFPNAVVAQAWLDREDVAEVLLAQAAFPLTRGIRHKPRSAARAEDAVRGAAGSMDDPRWRDGFALLERHGLSFDLQTPWWHLPAAADLARDFPRTTIILNHAGLPSDRSEEGLAAWWDAMALVAEMPNVAVKISGLGLSGRRWDAATNERVIRDVIASFGAQRCMFASNHPVDSLVAPFGRIFAAFADATRDEPAEVRASLFRDNATSFYRVGPGAHRVVASRTTNEGGRP